LKSTAPVNGAVGLHLQVNAPAVISLDMVPVLRRIIDKPW
jgi:hypothetical protein